MSFYENIAYSPEKFGLEVVGSIEWSDGSYQFDTTQVWRSLETGLYFVARDSGCSCPSPFEDHTVDSLDGPYTAHELMVSLEEEVQTEFRDEVAGYRYGASREEVDADFARLAERVMM